MTTPATFEVGTPIGSVGLAAVYNTSPVVERFAVNAQSSNGCTAEPSTWAQVLASVIPVNPHGPRTVKVHLTGAGPSGHELWVTFTEDTGARTDVAVSGTERIHGQASACRKTATHSSPMHGATGQAVTHAASAAPPRHSSGLPIALLGLGICVVATLAAVAIRRRLRRDAEGTHRRGRRERGAHRS